MEDKYLYMIRQAQEFMNENHYADVSRLHCLLRKMMPKEYLGFSHIADKNHKDGSSEYVLVKDMRTQVNDLMLDYPFVRKAGFGKYVLSINPEYHTKLFPDSILKTEQKYDLIQDVSETNSYL